MTTQVSRAVLADNARPRKNAIINGNFDVWQRGTTYSGASIVADRWFHYVPNGTLSVSRQTFDVGQTVVPGNPKHYMRLGIASSTGTNDFIRQRVENVLTLSGRQATVSFYAKLASGSVSQLEVRTYQHVGTGGTPSGSKWHLLGAFTPTTSWQKFTVTGTIPSMSGAVLGTDGNDRLELVLADRVGSQNFELDIAQVQLEAGPVATDFEYRPIGEELALCQRYYWKGAPSDRGLANIHTGDLNTYQLGPSASFPVTMRAVPAIAVVTAPTYTNCSHYDFQATADGFGQRLSPAATGIYRAALGIYEANAEL